MIAFPARQDTIEAAVRAVHAWALNHFIYERDDSRWAGDRWLILGERWETDAELIADIDRDGYVRGDCDAFAKLCWLALRHQGIPSRLVMCTTETGEGHLVCEAEGWVLDNRMPTLQPRADLERIGYRWQSMSAFEPGGQWTTVA